MIRIELLSPLPCHFSGVHLWLDKSNTMCGDGYKYKQHHLVLGWWIIGWRVWTINKKDVW